MIDANTSLGDLAATGTDARSVLLRYRLDFCCGGGRSLATACEAAELDPRSGRGRARGGRESRLGLRRLA